MNTARKLADQALPPEGPPEAPRAGGETPPPLPYAPALRAIGQDLEARGVTSFHLRRLGEGFVVAATEKTPPAESPPGFWQRLLGRTGAAGPPGGARLLRYTPDEIERLDALGRARRGRGGPRPDAFSPPELLRLVGADCDGRRVRLLSVIRRGPSLTVTYRFHTGAERTETHPASAFQGLSVHEYLRRSKRGGAELAHASP